MCERRWTGQSENRNSFPVLQWIGLGIPVKVSQWQMHRKLQGKGEFFIFLLLFPFPCHLNHQYPQHMSKNFFKFYFHFFNSRGIRVFVWTSPGLGDIVFKKSLYMHTTSPNIQLAGIIFVILSYWAILVGVGTAPIWNKGRNGVAVQLWPVPRMVHNPIVLTILPQHLSKLYLYMYLFWTDILCYRTCSHTETV